MLVFKCKMCGGTLEVNNNETVGVCEYCGTKQTLPKLDNERKSNLYDRANHFRRNDEFDKAMNIYEQILNEDRTDAESYWSIVLCRYGIEYVEDPTTHKRIPTVNRTQLTSIFDDEDYKSALQYADGYQREIYENEATVINEIQKGILAISQKEEPFDVFICYKETDKNGRRTQDSVLAQELYYELVEEGFKVFFAKITLEDKLGQEYEPYIFAALNSAKVMVVLGTKPEHFNAVWVKNEWSRYLALIKKGENKMLIPAYRDMDPYDLPDEFSHLQAQDMEKLGFMQDLVRGIKKIVENKETESVGKESVVVNNSVNAAPLLERAFLFLEDGDWESADEYCEKVLDIEPKNAMAYLGKLMAELWVKKQENLRDCAEPFEDNSNYQKVLRFGDEALVSTVSGYNAYIKERNENTRLEMVYTSAVEKMNSAETESQYNLVAKTFESIKDYKDSKELIEKCMEQAKVAHEQAEMVRKDDIYNSALFKYNVNSVSDIEEAVALLESIPDWRDSRTKIAEYQHKIKEVQEENKRKKRKRTLIEILSILVVAAIMTFIIVLVEVIIPNNKYEKAISLSEREQYDEAIAILSGLNDYKDSNVLLVDVKYEYAIECLDEKQFQKGFDLLTEIKDYKDAAQILENFKFVKKQKKIKDGYITEYIYDETGKCLKEEITDSKGSLSTTEYTYNEAGKCLTEVHLGYDGSKTIIEYSYDVNGKCIKKEETKSDGYKYVTEYSYGANGKRSRMVESSSGGLYYVTEYTYDTGGNLIKKEEIFNGGVQTIIEYSYDEQGNRIKEVKNDSEGIQNVIIYIYNEQGNCLSEKSNHRSGYWYVARSSYDERGNLISEITNNSDSETQSQNYTYDENGNCVKYVLCMVDGEEHVEEYSYTVIYKE